MKLLLGLVIAVTLMHDECDTTKEQMKQRQDIVDLCEAHGGIPILNAYGDNITRCEFPPQFPNPEKK